MGYRHNEAGGRVVENGGPNGVVPNGSAPERPSSRFPRPRFWQRPWPLRTALGLFALTIVAPILLLLGLQHRDAVVDKQADIELQGHQYVRSIAADINRELAIKRAQLAALATSQALRDGNYADFHIRATAALKESYGWIALLRADGTQLINTLEPAGEGLAPLAIADVLARVVRTGQAEESNLFTSKFTQQFTVASLYPVGFGDLVLSGGLPAEHLSGVLRSALPDGWLAMLCDRQGKVIARSSNAEDYVGNPVNPELWQQHVSASPEGWMASTTLDGVQSFISWFRLPNGWTATVSVPRETIEQPMRVWEQQVFWSVIFFSVLAVVGAALTGEWIARSIAELTAAAKLIGRGEIPSPVITNLREVNDAGEALSRASQERWRAEAALRESETRLRAIFDQSSVGISIVDLDGRFLAANRRHGEITGYSETDLRTKTTLEITHPDDRRRNIELLNAMMAEGKSYTMDKRLIRKDGTSIWVQVSGVAVRDAAGKPLYAIGVVLDIDERKRAEMANAHLAAVVASSGDAIKSLALDGTIVTWNRAAEKLYRYTAGEAIGRHVSFLVPEDRRHEVESNLAAARVGGNFRVEATHRRKDGSLVDVSVDAAPMRAADGTVIGISTIAHDITERKRAESAVREGERRLAGVIESAIDAIISVDERQRIILFNPAAEKMFGTPAAEAIGSSLSRYIPERLRAAHAAHLTRFAETRVTSRRMGALGAVTGLRADGEEFPIEASISQVEVAGERIFTVILRDISARQRAETELQEREQQFRALANSIPQLAWMANPDGWMAWYNERWYEYTGTTPQQMEGWGWQSVPDPAVLPRVLERWKGSLASGEPFDMIFPLKGADGVFRPFLTRAMALRDAKGRIARWFGTNTDITAQKEHEAHLNFVMRELSHRSKNLLAVVQAMSRQTIQHSGDFADFEGRFIGRLDGLARSHDVLVQKDWAGAAIRDLVHAQLAPFAREDGTSVDVDGPDLILRPDAVQDFGFALFELATNAVKYGALSAPAGKVTIRWELVSTDKGEHILFTWRESGGPPVIPPERKGFGAVVIERFISAALSGQVESAFLPEGFCWTIEIPTDRVLSDAQGKRPSARAALH